MKTLSLFIFPFKFLLASGALILIDLLLVLGIIGKLLFLYLTTLVVYMVAILVSTVEYIAYGDTYLGYNLSNPYFKFSHEVSKLYEHASETLNFRRAYFSSLTMRKK